MALELGPALKVAVDEVLAEIGARRQLVNVGPANAIVGKLCDVVGLVPIMPYHRLKWDNGGALVDVSAVEGVTMAPYAGGDPDTNAGIAAVWKSAFRSDPIEPVLTPEVLEEAVRTLDIWFMVAREDDGGRVVGLSEAGPGSYFSGIAVARSHWGKGLADALVLATCNEFMARGINDLNSMTRTTNRPSLALQDRLGWEIFEDGMMYATPVPDSE